MMDSDNGDTQAALSELLDERAIAAVIIRVGRAQDARDWATYEHCFAERVLVEQPMDPSWVTREVPASEWALRAASTLDGFDVTQHCLSNLQIDLRGDDADAEVEVVAHHEIHGIPESKYTLGGRYHIALRRAAAGWLITRRRLQVRWESGNRDLTQMARDRVAARGVARPAASR